MALISAGTWTATCGGVVAPTSVKTFINYQPIVRNGDLLNHGGVVVGTSTIIVEGLPAATVDDLVTSHTIGDSVHTPPVGTLIINVNSGL